MTGFPAAIRVDQGSEFVSRDLDLWAYQRGVTLDFSRPGKPTDNAYAESFNATVRLECLGRCWFLDLDDAREKVEEWWIEYNGVRPHSAIGHRTPLSLIHQPRQSAEAPTRPEISQLKRSNFWDASHTPGKSPARWSNNGERLKGTGDCGSIS